MLLRSIVLVVGAGLVLHAGAGLAAPTLTVNSPFDVIAGGDLTNGVCETAPGNGVCTLRAAVMKANRFPGGGVTINIPSGTYTLTIPQGTAGGDTTGHVFINSTTTIIGAGMYSTVVDGGGTISNFGVIFVNPIGTASISNLTVQNGRGGNGSEGGGIFNAGGNLTLNNIRITNNQAEMGGGFTNGFGTAVINNSLIDNNVSTGVGGGVYNVAGLLTLNHSAVVGNTAGGDGGGIFDSGQATAAGVLTLNDTSVSGNRATRGGGIQTNSGDMTSLTLNRSTINANSALQDGGGIFVDSITPSNNMMTINNSTLSANSAQGNAGGIYNLGTGSVFLVTIAGNVAQANGSAGLGSAIYNNGSLSLGNSLLGDNYLGFSLSGVCDGKSVIISQDYNFSEGACNLSGMTTHNLAGGDPLLGPLQNNGGATQTRALLAGSIVADQIPPALCRDSLGVAPTTDQRGVQRPINGLCDMGAFEGSVPLPLFDANLIRNGDAEDGGGSVTGAFVGSPHWTVTAGTLTVVPYGAPGGFPIVGTDTIPATHGYNFFAGGAAASSQATQMITVTAGSAAIDTGTVKYNLSGDFGGFALDNDSAQLSISFLDSNQLTIGKPISIGNFDAAYRNNKTGLFPASATGVVPVGTRYVQANLKMTLVNGAYNDGYADNLSLIFTGGPSMPDLNQHGLTGSWYQPVTSGQGLEVEVFPDLSAPGNGLTQVSWFTFDTVVGGPDRQRWYTLSGPVVSGQPSALLTIYQNTGGNFNAPPVTTAHAVGTAALSFDTCASGQLSYSFTDGSGRSGSMLLTRLTQNVTCSTTSARPTNADFALSGNWYDATTSGQGFTVEVNPNSGALFVAWYTYAPAGASAAAAGQRWFTAQGTFAPGSRSIPLQIYETTAGIFDVATVPTPSTVAVGSGTLAFQSCSSATLSYNFTGGSSSGTTGTIKLGRIGPVPPGCVQ